MSQGLYLFCGSYGITSSSHRHGALKSPKVTVRSSLWIVALGERGSLLLKATGYMRHGTLRTRRLRGGRGERQKRMLLSDDVEGDRGGLGLASSGGGDGDGVIAEGGVSGDGDVHG